VPELTVILWRDIPAQVTASDGSATARRELSDRFQKAIDAAAMKAGLIDSDAYLEGWRRATRTCGPDIETEVAEEADRLEASHDRATLLGLTRTGGVRED
jgi:cvfA/B/C family virulence factor